MRVRVCCTPAQWALTLHSHLMRSYNVRARKSSDHIKMPLSTVHMCPPSRRRRRRHCLMWTCVTVVVSDFLALDSSSSSQHKYIHTPTHKQQRTHCVTLGARATLVFLEPRLSNGRERYTHDDRQHHKSPEHPVHRQSDPGLYYPHCLLAVVECAWAKITLQPHVAGERRGACVRAGWCSPAHTQRPTRGRLLQHMFCARARSVVAEQRHHHTTPSTTRPWAQTQKHAHADAERMSRVYLRDFMRLSISIQQNTTIILLLYKRGGARKNPKRTRKCERNMNKFSRLSPARRRVQLIQMAADRPVVYQFSYAHPPLGGMTQRGFCPCHVMWFAGERIHACGI